MVECYSCSQQVSNDAYQTIKSLIKVEKIFVTNHQKIGGLEPLVKFIDLSQVRGQILADIIEPLEIIQQKVRSNNTDSNWIRGIPQTIYNESDLSQHVGQTLLLKMVEKLYDQILTCGKVLELKWY